MLVATLHRREQRNLALVIQKERTRLFRFVPILRADLVVIEAQVRAATKNHNRFLRELELSPLPFAEE